MRILRRWRALSGQSDVGLMHSSKLCQEKSSLVLLFIQACISLPIDPG
jgi:hypothetical protein